ncbi:hypothetical protein ACVGVM_24635 [Pseudonocardia bannensis]|uniref:site-specific integrase n=1 Tax=Pseudonocardia bannensis TaxID=630973 RepID=UPI001B7D0E1B|nr:site-specific integrase [Pseudonocardia bannensis]
MERRLLGKNPITSLAWKAPRTAKGVDKQGVVNPVQARALLAAVRQQTPSGPRLVAFFGAMYYAGLRPAEAAKLRRSNLMWRKARITAPSPEETVSRWPVDPTTCGTQLCRPG